MTNVDRFVILDVMAKNISPGSGARSGTPRTRVPAPDPASASVDRLTQLEDILQDVRSTLTGRIESMDREIASVHRILEIRGHEIRWYAKIE